MAESMPVTAETPEDFVTLIALPKSRLDRLVHHVARLHRKAHLTADEARYVHKRAENLLSRTAPAERLALLDDEPSQPLAENQV